MKRCSKCGEEKPATAEYFNRNRNSPGGLIAHCKKCRKKIQASYREANREKLREYQRDLRPPRKNSESRKEYMRAYGRAWRGSHPEYMREYMRAWGKENRARRNQYYRIWCNKNPEKVRALRAQRRARIVCAEGNHTDADIQRQYKAQKGRCYYCKCKVGDDYHIDHIVPLSRGGSNGPENLVVACPTCNYSKRDKLPHEWPQGGRLL